MGINGVNDHFSAACKIEEQKFVAENTKQQLAALRRHNPDLAAQDKYAEAVRHLTK